MVIPVQISMRNHLPRRFRPGVALVLGAALALGACRDAPTGPRMVRQGAGGEEWIAVTLPEGLPSLETWLPYVAGPERRGDGGGAAALVRRMRRDAAAEREAGRYDEATALTREATRVAITSLARAPEGPVLLLATQALRVWSERVRLEVPLERHPELDAAWRAVDAARESAEAAVAEGDTAAAVRHLIAGVERVQEHSPAAVALRVIERAEERLASDEVGAFERERAVHLLGTARQEIHLGDDVRALRRALYALQIAEGNAVAGPGDPLADCAAEGCAAVEGSP